MPGKSRVERGVHNAACVESSYIFDQPNGSDRCRSGMFEMASTAQTAKTLLKSEVERRLQQHQLAMHTRIAVDTRKKVGYSQVIKCRCGRVGRTSQDFFSRFPWPKIET
jgi:hypothetical protein